MKKAIVFGGSGFVGSHVADALTNAGIETTIFDVCPAKYINDQQIFIQGDILDQELVNKAIRGKDYVYHFAGQADIELGFKDPKRTLDINIQGTINILESCRKFSIERFVFASTIYVYSNVGGFYRASKQACELIIEEYQKNFNVDFTILRYGSLYGRRADERNLIYNILKQAILNKKINIQYDQDEKRDYIHVKDAANMSCEILSPEYKNSRVMLTGYQQISRGDLLNMVSEMLGGGVAIQQSSNTNDWLSGHYKFTPYVFKPEISKKITSKQYLEFGQGLLDCIHEIYERYVAEKV